MASNFNSFDESPFGGAFLESPVFARNAPSLPALVSFRYAAAWHRIPYFAAVYPGQSQPTDTAARALNALRQFRTRVFTRPHFNGLTFETRTITDSTSLVGRNPMHSESISPEDYTFADLTNDLAAGCVDQADGSPTDPRIDSRSPTAAHLDDGGGVFDYTDTRSAEWPYAAIETELRARVNTADFDDLWTNSRSIEMYYNEWWDQLEPFPPAGSYDGSEQSLYLDAAGFLPLPFGFDQTSAAIRAENQGQSYIARVQARCSQSSFNYIFVETFAGGWVNGKARNIYRLLGSGTLNPGETVEFPASTLDFQPINILSGDAAANGSTVSMYFNISFEEFLAANNGFETTDWS